MINLKDSVAIVTGASSGIGASLSRLFSDRGAKVVLAARREERLKAVADSCRGEVLTVKTDLVAENDQKHLIDQTLGRWGRIDILVNNAGLGAYGTFLDATEAQWRRLFEINLFAPVLLTQKVLPLMQARNSGWVINVASIAGLIAHADKVTHYVASKHALVGFSRGLARDLEGTGIRVLAVCPHLTDTDFFASSPGAEEMAPLLNGLKPYLDSPDDVARGILAGMEAGSLIVFPTDQPARAYKKNRDI